MNAAAAAEPDAAEAARIEAQERSSFLRVVAAYRSYEADALEEVSRWEANYALLPAAHRDALASTQPASFAAARAAIHINAEFIRDMLSVFESDNAPPHLRISAVGDGDGASRPTPAEA